MRHNLTERERDTVLAALRLWQKVELPTQQPDPLLREIASGNHGNILGPAEVDSLCERLNEPDDPDDEAVREMARAEYEREGELEIDGGATVSRGDDNGAYVEAWVWVSFHGTPFDKEAEPEAEAAPAPKPAVAYHCPECGSSNVGWDAVATWDSERGTHELAGTHDNCTCLDCGADEIRPEEKPT